MLVLHYIEKKKTSADIIDKYMPALIQCMAEMADNRITSSLKEIKSIANETHPDIVHIHTCWSLGAWRTGKWCKKQRIPVVFSPHRQLEPWHVAHHYWRSKLPMLILFQKGIIKRAKAIQTSTNQEQSNILLLDYHSIIRSSKAWNKRVVTIKNYLADGSITDRQMAFDMRRLYQKVIDSYPFLVMDDKEKIAENALLRRSLAKDDVSAYLPNKTKDIISQLSADSWRKILLHSNDEGITEEINKGISAMNINVPNINICNIQRFEKEKEKNLSPLKNDQAIKKQLRLDEIAEEEKASADEVKICTMFLNLKQEIKKRTLSKRHIADIYTIIRFTNYDEDKVERMLKLLNIRTFSGRILQIMKETLSLEEGFIPFETINDRGTTKIKKILLKTDIQ